jgi:hypothetical protein
MEGFVRAASLRVACAHCALDAAYDYPALLVPDQQVLKSTPGRRGSLVSLAVRLCAETGEPDGNVLIASHHHP